eukprot:TRINITY_DN17496_c0_g1_i8.p2 TRINITY_DN17496_c0_g1~~TRINITY_DN17496_c0_g1_i8.p2  ORF type:complete len:123 (-),score=7.18 TRINITY_DN17496_c0_g1_i8:76-444(-)
MIHRKAMVVLVQESARKAMVVLVQESARKAMVVLVQESAPGSGEDRKARILCQDRWLNTKLYLYQPYLCSSWLRRQAWPIHVCGGIRLPNLGIYVLFLSLPGSRGSQNLLLKMIHRNRSPTA